MENQVSQPVPADKLAQVQQHLDAARALLAPYLVPLTPEQRQDLPKMGDKSVAFVQKAADYSTALAPYLPVISQPSCAGNSLACCHGRRA